MEDLADISEPQVTHLEKLNIYMISIFYLLVHVSI